MHLHLVDWSADVTEALAEAFAVHPEVTVLHRPILEVAEDTLVSPANSLGHMDGGIDQVYIDHFGPDLQRRVYEAIDRHSQGFLPVGRALLVKTGHDRIPRLIVAPTMESPGPVAPANVYFAMAAFLTAARELPAGSRVFCPGFGTGVGHVDPEDAAREMAAAYAKWKARTGASGGTGEAP